MEKKLGNILIGVSLMIILIRNFNGFSLPVVIPGLILAAGIILLGISAYKDQKLRNFLLLILVYGIILSVLIFLQ